MRKIISTLLCIIISNILNSQELRLPENILKIIEKDEIIHLFSNSARYEYNLQTNELTAAIKIKNDFNIGDFKPLFVNNTIFFIQGSGGVVLKFENNVIKRIDKSYDHKMQYVSSIFTINNEIYKYGGYGFFSARDFIVKYDFSSNEWESVIINSDLKPRGRFDVGHIIRDNNFYIIGGHTVDEKNRENRLSLNDLWEFSFKSFQWKKISEYEDFKFFNSNSFQNNNIILNRHNGQLISYDLDKNSLNKYQLNSMLIKIDQKYPIIKRNNKFYFVIKRNNKENVLISRNQDEFLGNKLSSKIISKKNKLLTLFILITIFSFIYLIIKNINKYNKTVFVEKNRLKYKRKVISITYDEFNIIKGFVNNNFILENNKILEKTYKKQYDRTHNIRLKNNLLINLNSKFQLLLGNSSKKFIISFQSEYDKRYKTYNLKLKNLIIKLNEK